MTGVQTCALPISPVAGDRWDPAASEPLDRGTHGRGDDQGEEEQPEYEPELPERQGHDDDSDDHEGGDGGTTGSLDHGPAIPAKCDR